MENESTLHKCAECGRDFKTTSALISHMKAGHKSDTIVVTDEPELRRFVQPPDHIELETPHQTSVPKTLILGSAVETPAVPIITVKKLPHYGELPDIARATSGSAGFDLYAAISLPICIGVNEKVGIPTGLCFDIPEGLFGLIAPRSGLACKHDITVANSPGIIDSDYRGEVICHMKNHSNTKFWIQPGMRVAQIIFTNFAAPDIVFSTHLTLTGRGTGGFGSTGGM